jgi:Peptidase MA superfamily
MRSLVGVLLAGMLVLSPLRGAAAVSEKIHALETDAVRVLFPTGRTTTAERIAELSPALLRELEMATGLSFDFRPTVIPAFSRTVFRRMGGREAFVAFALPEQEQVVLDISRLEHRPAYFKPVLKHEYAHLLLHRHIASSRLPRWLDEGIAQQLSDGLSEYLPGRSQAVLGEALATDRVFTLAALERYFPADTFGIQLAYEQSRSIVGYMVQRYGDPFLKELVIHMAGGLPVGRAFKTASGISLADFEADWRRRQKAPLSWLGRIAGHVYSILFFGAALATLIGYIRHRRRRRDYDAEDDDDGLQD